MITKCRHCDKPIALNKTAWTCGPMFCSHKCGVDWAKTLYKPDEYVGVIDLKQKATAYFNDVAEEISREDYGARAEYYTAYSEEYDISTIFEQIFEGDEIVSMSAIGWYYGRPTAENDKEFAGKLTAVFAD